MKYQNITQVFLQSEEIKFQKWLNDNNNDNDRDNDSDDNDDNNNDNDIDNDNDNDNDSDSDSDSDSDNDNKRFWNGLHQAYSGTLSHCNVRRLKAT